MRKLELHDIMLSRESLIKFRLNWFQLTAPQAQVVRLGRRRHNTTLLFA